MRLDASDLQGSSLNLLNGLDRTRLLVSGMDRVRRRGPTEQLDPMAHPRHRESAIRVLFTSFCHHPGPRRPGAIHPRPSLRVRRTDPDWLRYQLMLQSPGLGSQVNALSESVVRRFQKPPISPTTCANSKQWWIAPCKAVSKAMLGMRDRSSGPKGITGPF